MPSDSLNALLDRLPADPNRRFARACWEALTSEPVGSIPDPAQFGLHAECSLDILMAVFAATRQEADHA